MPIQFLKKISAWVNHTKRKAILIVIIVLILGFFFYPKPSGVPEVWTVKKQDITQSLSVSGSISSRHIANLNFLTSGKLVYLGVQKGDFVHKNQTIAALDTRTVQKNLQNTLRDYGKQRNTFDQAKDDNKDKVLTDTLKRVLDNNQNDLDKAVTSVELQAIAQENSFLVSPIDGYLTAGDSNLAGTNISATTVFTVADLDNLVFNIDVDEADIGKVKQGQEAKVIFDAFPGQEVVIVVDTIDYTSHTTSTGGTAYTVQGKIPSTTKTQYRIGMNGDAQIILDKKNNVLSIPTSSLAEDRYVYLQTNKGFEKKEVTLGVQSDTQSEVISGLREGEKIAVQPSSVTPIKK